MPCAAPAAVQQKTESGTLQMAWPERARAETSNHLRFAHVLQGRGEHTSTRDRSSQQSTSGSLCALRLANSPCRFRRARKGLDGGLLASVSPDIKTVQATEITLCSHGHEIIWHSRPCFDQP